MESCLVRNGLRRAIAAARPVTKKQRALHSSPQSRADLAKAGDVSSEAAGDIRAAAPIRFLTDPNQFSARRPRAQLLNDDTSPSNRYGRRPRSDDRNGNGGRRPLLDRVRVVPASPSYFTALPKHMDDLLHLSGLLRKYQLLPVASSDEVPNVRWRTRLDYRTELQEPVRAKSYEALLDLLKRLNKIHFSLIPAEVTETLERYKRLVQPHFNQAKPIIVNEAGIARAVGRRKSSHAAVFLVEGEGKCLINGRSLSEYFGRLHDRESAVWALKATQRLDKYNIWAIAKGGGTTGQADALSLGLAKALLAHEPDLKPALRRARVITRDRRRVERKKPGKLKARKMPAWVKR